MHSLRSASHENSRHLNIFVTLGLSDQISQNRASTTLLFLQQKFNCYVDCLMGFKETIYYIDDFLCAKTLFQSHGCRKIKCANRLSS